MNRLNLIMMALALVLSAKAEVKTLKVKVANPSSVERTAVPVVVPLAEQYSTALVKLGDKEIPCQLDDLNDDGVYDELSFLTNLVFGCSIRKQFPIKGFNDVVGKCLFQIRVFFMDKALHDGVTLKV